MQTTHHDEMRRQVIREAVNAANIRSGGYQPLYLMGYCDSPDCPAREVTIFIKDYDRELDALLTRHGFRCPICQRILKTHEVLTLEEHRRHQDQLARMSVNAQLYQQRTGSGFIPATVLMDDSLPDKS